MNKSLWLADWYMTANIYSAAIHPKFSSSVILQFISIYAIIIDDDKWKLWILDNFPTVF